MKDTETFTITQGRCRRCQMDCELFPGKIYCDPCIAAMQERDAQDRAYDEYKMAIRTGKFHGWLSSDFERYQTALSEKGESNSAAWDTCMASERNLFIYGEPGTGKTHVARCLLHLALKTEKTVAEQNAPMLIRGMRLFNRPAFCDAVMRNQLVLIDDLDKITPEPANLTALWEVMDARCQPGRRTIITANVDPRTLTKYFSTGGGNETTARAALNRLNPVDIVHFAGESWRTKEGQ